MDKSDHYKIDGASKGVRHQEYHINEEGELVCLESSTAIVQEEGEQEHIAAGKLCDRDVTIPMRQAITGMVVVVFLCVLLGILILNF